MKFSTLRKAVPLLMTGSCLVLGGCVSGDGPRGELVRNQASLIVNDDKPHNLPYCLVPLSKTVLAVAEANQPRLRGNLSNHHSRPGVRFGIGDVVSVTLFEAAAGGLFFPLDNSSRQGNFLTLPVQRVDSNGNISIPYAGQIKASGRTVVEIQSAIVSALSSRALDPQAVVTLTEQHADLISVLGEVGAPTRIAASASGERVLDAVSRAGGLKGPGQESWLMLERSGSVQVVPFEALVRQPENNIEVQAQDTLYVFREPQTFLAFGAVSRQGQMAFESWRLTLSEALGKAGGLVDQQAEPAWVYLYRAESREVAEDVAPGCKVGNGPFVPVVYQADLRDPSGYFLTSQFPMRNKDVVFVANSRNVEATKLMTFVRDLNSTIQSPLQTGVEYQTLKQLVQGTASSTVLTTTTAASH